ncbi:MAG: TRAP transporter small permease [Deltaproteobacteria bacterium]|nr:TRAP transporter small permease [Deltaproteobacteria bacterium]
MEWLSRQLGWIGGGLTAVMMIAVMREVIGRYFFNSPSDWSLELSCYMLVGLSYLSAAYTEMVDGHIRIDFLYERFSGKRKALVDVIIPLIGMTWAVIVVWQGGRLAFKSLAIGARSSQAMEWPLFPSQILVPIGGVMLGLILLGKVIKAMNILFRGEK